METMMCYELYENDFRGVNYSGPFVICGDTVCFYFTKNNSVIELNCDTGIVRTVFTETEAERLTLPALWQITNVNNSALLMCGDALCIELQTGKVVEEIPEPLLNKYLSRWEQFPDKRIETEPYIFGEYSISQLSQCKYLCTKKNDTQWTFTARAYIATDIHYFNGNVFWGTSGNGGYFYILDLQSGMPKLILQTGATNSFVQVGNVCYIGQKEKNASYVVCVSLKDGRILERFPIQGDYTYHSRMCFQNDKLYVVSFENKKNITSKIIMSVLKTGDGLREPS